MRKIFHEILKHYGERRREIEERLGEFARFDRRDRERVFNELAFCLCTPQTKAKSAFKAVCYLSESGLLWNGSKRQVAYILRRFGVRFHNVKAGHIVYNRRKVGQLIPLLDNVDGRVLREILVREVKGFGMKEASHFLRNIGYSDVAIIDRHILRWMKRLGYIRRLPRRIDSETYVELERRFFRMAGDMGLRGCILDMVLWSASTGEVFK
ncbi:putative N-glycosylase/DNA lyase [archaeon HR01]|nr:putative N-glycosylase/DNA lyase [archaeon HR01]